MQYPQLNRNLKPAPAHPERVLQFGEGNFLRAFVNWMIHEMNQKAGFDAGVTVVQPIDRGLVDMLNAQDGLYTVCLTGIKNGQAVQEQTLVDCIQRGINPYHDFLSYLATAHNPELRFIISNTTEAGIAFDNEDKLKDAPPGSFPAKLTRLLYERFQAFDGDASKGLIIIPCELIDRNGDILRNVVQQYADLWKLSTEFKNWVEKACTFCNTLVDRIVPGYPKDRISELQETLGYEDKLITEGERFHLWVIEAPAWVEEEFPAKKAGLNVIFTNDMTPYRTRKVRILNGAHTAMVPVAYLYGLRTVRETVEDHVLGKFVSELVYEEIIPTLDLPESELKSFAADVLDRFRNPYIKHFLISIALNSTSKFETRVLPSLLEYVNRKGALPRRIVFALAALIRFYKGSTVAGEAIMLNDDADRLAFFYKAWEQYEQDLSGLAQVVLARTDFWGQDLNQISGLHHLLTVYLQKMELNDFKTALADMN